MSADRVHLVVIYGGQSAEHDVSRVTASHVLRAVDLDRYDVSPIAISRDGAWSVPPDVVAALEARSQELPESLTIEGAPTSSSELMATAGATSRPTVVLPLLHGPMGEDGTVQGLLELADVAYVGSGVLGSAVAMDKVMAKRVLDAHGIAQARWRGIEESDWTDSTAGDLVAELGLPLFVKPANMGSSVGVSKCRSVAEVASAASLAYTYDEWIVCEEAVAGREIEVGVLGGSPPEASGAGEIVPGEDFYSYEDKYVTDGATLLIPAPLDDAELATVRALAVDVFRALRCDGLARIDFFYEDGPGGRGFLCNEANTMPGFTPISMFPKLWAAAGVPYPELIDRLVTLAVERHARRRRNTKR